MNAHPWRALRHLLASCLPVERSQIAWGVGVRTSITMVVVLGLAAHSDNLELGVPFALGVFLTNLSDMNEPPWLRWRTMLVTAIACALATLLGGLVSESDGDGGYKFNFDWAIEFTERDETKTIATIYDWKYERVVGLTEKVEWNIGGNSREAVRLVEKMLCGALGLKVSYTQAKSAR